MLERVKEIIDLNEYVVFDLETRGLDFIPNQITQIGMIKIKNNEIVDTLSSYVKCDGHIPSKLTKLTGISDEMVVNAPTIDELKEQIIEFAEELPIMGQNSEYFDIPMLKVNNIEFKNDNRFDTYLMAKTGVQGINLGGNRFNLDALVERYNIDIERPEHDATLDATLTHHVFKAMQKEFEVAYNKIISYMNH